MRIMYQERYYTGECGTTSGPEYCRSVVPSGGRQPVRTEIVPWIAHRRAASRAAALAAARRPVSSWSLLWSCDTPTAQTTPLCRRCLLFYNYSTCTLYSRYNTASCEPVYLSFVVIYRLYDILCVCCSDFASSPCGLAPARRHPPSAPPPCGHHTHSRRVGTLWPLLAKGHSCSRFYSDDEPLSKDLQ